MDKFITKGLFCLALFTLFTVKYASAQSITIQNFTTGTYTPGSSIAVPFNVSSNSCIQQTNIFQLYLADASGNILPGGPISTYAGFYATFLNAVIPAGTAPGSYTMVVKSTNPAITSAPSPVFTVAAGAAVTAGLIGPSISPSYPSVFGVCNGTPNNTFSFFDGSSSGSSTANFFNESTQASEGTVAIANTGNFTAQTTNYTIIDQATNGTTISTQAYILLNNVINNAFSVSNSSTVCLIPLGGGTLCYNVTTTTANGIQNNYPGTLYSVTWGDGSSNSYTFCDINALSGQICHTYTTGSCGNSVNGQNNVFEVDIQPQSPYCPNNVSPLTSYAKIIKVPINSFTFPPTGCSNSTITFTNTSDPGQDPNATTNTCTNPNARYTWYIDGVPKGFNYTLAQTFTYSFPTNGTHSITLQLNNSGTGVCSTTNNTETICIQNPPVPNFSLPASTICVSNTLTPTDLSVVDNTCSSTNTYLWSVTGPGTVSYAGGTNSGSQQPQFVFSQPGTYQITLSIASLNCGSPSVTQTVVVDGPPSITMSPDASICGTNFTYNFNTNPGITQTTISGTTQPQANTYTWTVTGNPAYSFVGGTTANSQYPQIMFTGYGTYTVSVTEQNSCGTLTQSQNLTFQNVPVVTIDPVSTVCPGTPVNLSGHVLPATYTSLQWSGGSGTFTGSTTLTPTYTPSAAEIAAGSVTLTLNVATGLTGSCSNLIQTITINIFPANNITSPPTESICTGSAVNYGITALIPGSTFTWTAATTTGSATGFTASGSGNTINDVLIDTDPVNIAVVTYTITPVDPNGCVGPPFALKVTINTNTVITAVPVNNVICSGSPAAINLTANVSGTTYTWTSTVTGGITGNSQQSAATTATQINDVLNNSGTTAGSVTYIITPYNGICSGAPVTTTITVQPLPVTSNPGPNDVKCNITTYTLNGNTPPAGAGLWTVIPAGTVTFNDNTLPNATASGLIPGINYTFTWTITIPGCQSSSNSVIIQDNALSVGGTTNGATTVCSGNNNGNITLTGQVGNILRWESSIDNGTTWQPIANTSTTQPYTNLTQTTQYRAVVQNGICAFAYSTVTAIAVSQPAIIANAGTDQVVCNATSYTLNGNNPTPGAGLWTVTSGQTGLIFSNPAQYNATVSGMVPGTTYQFTWTITPAAPCAPNSSVVTITDDAPTIGGTTAGANTFCAGNNNNGTITLTGELGVILRWESSTDNGTTWQPIANTTTSQTYVNVTQTTEYRAVVQNGSCAFAYSTVSTIVINPPAVLANAGTNQVVCNATTYTLNGNSPVPGTGLWTLTSGQAGITFSNATLPNATVSGMVPGQTYQFTWTITPAAPCTPNSSVVIITDDLPTVGGTTSSDANVCAGNNGATITLTGQVGTVLRWESSIDNGTTWQTIANTSTLLQYTNVTQTTLYRAVVQSGICAFAYSTVTTIAVYPLAVLANAGTNQELCNITSYPLNGNNPAPGTGLWTVTSSQTGITFSDPTQYNATVSGLVPGQTYQFTWTITPSAPCSPNSSTVTITDDELSNGGNTTGANTVCSGNSNGSITLSGQLGNILNWESSIDNGTTWQAIANTTATQSYLNLTQTTQYRAVVQNGVCAFAYSTVTAIIVNPPAVPANAGTDQELCNITSYPLNGNNPAPGTGLWTVTSGQTGITFSDPTQANATVSGLVPGQTYQFKWTITPGAPCTPSSSSVTITDDALSVGGTTAGANTVCSGNSNGSITLSGQLGNILNWESSIDNGTTWQAIANTTATQPYLNLTQTTQYRAVVQNGVCAFAYSTVTVIVVNPPAVPANAGANQVICNATSYPLQGNDPSPGTGLWTVTSGQTGITFSDPTQATATVSGLVPGTTYHFSWTITPGAPCTPSTSSVTITDDAPSAGGTTAGANTVCSGSSNGNITLSGQFGNILNWESSIDNGTTWQAIANTTATQPYLNLTQTTQYRAVVQNGICAFAYSTVTIIVVNPPAVLANAGANQEVCNLTSYPLNGNSPTPGTGLWTVTSGQTGITFSDPTLPNATVSGLVPGNIYQFAWTITPAAPCTPNSSSVTITDDASSVGGITAGANTVCSGNSNGNITLSGQLGNILNWESSIDNGTTWQAIANTTTTQPYLNLTQTTQYRAVVQNGICAFAYSTTTTIVVNPPAVPANAGTNQEVCNAVTFTLNGNSPLPGTGLWTLTSGQTGITFSDPTQPNATASGLIPGNTYQFTWTITPAAPCSPNSSSVTITDDAPSIGGITAGANTYCAGSNNNGTITLTGQLGNILRWESSIDNGTTWQPLPNTTATQPYINLAQTTQYRAAVQNGVCTFAYSTITVIVINPPAVTANAGANQEVCNAAIYTLQGNDPTPGTGLWTVTSGQTGITFSDPTQPTATASGLLPGQTYQFLWTITPAAPCAPNSSSVTITNDAPSVGGITSGSAMYCAGTNNSGTITLTGQLGNILRWESSVDNGTTWQAIANTGTSLPYINLTQTTQYRVAVQNGVCTIGYSTVSTIVINQPAVPAYAGINQEVCNLTSYTLDGNSPTPGTGLWTVTSSQTGLTFSDATQPNATVSGMVPGQTYKFTWTITPGAPCAPNSSSVTITDDAPTVGGTTAGGGTFCSGSNVSGAITLTGQVGNILRWESSIDNGTTWQPIANTGTTQQYLNLTQTTQYRAVVQNMLCAFAYSTVSVIIVTPPAVLANAGTNQEICNATTYTLNGNTAPPGTGLWTVTSGQTGITFSDPTLASAIVSGMIPGQIYQFTWTITPLAPCAPNSSSVTITDDAPSIGGTTTGGNTFCAGINISGTITLTGQFGNVLRWESSTDNGSTWQPIANTTTSQPYINLTQTTQYRAVVQNGVCTFAYSTVSIIVVNPAAVQANAGTNQEVCNVTSYPLQGNNPLPATGLWTVTSGQTGITFSDPTQQNATVNGLIPGNIYQFTWTITPTAPCTPNSSTVTITDDLPTAGGTTAGASTVCSGNNSGSITLSGQVGNILRWESSTDNGATWLAIANTTATQQYTNLTQTTQYRAAVQSGVCTFAYSTVTAIIVNIPAVLANAGANQELCNAASYVLQANSPFPGNGLWTVTSGQSGIVFSDATLPNATVSGLIPGQTYQFSWTITPTLPCTPNSSSVTITDDAPSIGGTTGGAGTFCAGSNVSGIITLTGQLGTILRWESSTDNGTTWQAIANTTASLQYINLAQTTQYRAVVQNGVCTFAYSTVSAIVVNPPAVLANAGANQEVCNATSYTLQGNSPSPVTGLWTVTSAQTGITFSDATLPNATANGLIPGNTYQFTWTVTPGAPCTPNASSVTITDDAPTVGGTTAGANTFCAGSNNSGTITLTGQIGNVLRWESSTDNGTTWLAIANTTTTQPYINLTQTTQYRAAVQNGVCTFAYSTITTIIINPAAVTANAGTNQELCNAASYTLQGNSATPGTGLWTVTSGQTGITFSDPTLPNATVSGLMPGNVYQFTWTITPAAPCTPNSSSVTITNDAPSAGGTTAGANTFCAGSNNNGTITLTGQIGNVLRWESSIDNGTTWQPIANTTTTQSYTNLTQTTEYRAAVQNGVCTFAYSAITVIIINPTGIIASAGTNQELCNITSYTLQGNSPTPGTGLWTVTSGQTGITFSDPTQPNAIVNGMVPGNTYTFTWTITPGAPCTPNSSSVTITDDAPSAGGTTGGANTFCAGSNVSGTITLAGQLGNILRWESSTDNGITWLPIINATTSQPYLSLTKTTEYRAVVQNGVCAFAYSTVSIIVINPAAVMANAGADQELCNATSYTLQGNTPTPGTGVWTVISGQTGITFSDSTQFNTTVSGLIPGQTYQFTWTITPAAPCTPNSSSVTITDDAPSAGGTTTGANMYCAGSTNSGAITLSGQVGNILRWELSTNNGATWQSIINTTTTQQYINLAQTTQYRAVVQNGVCTFAYSTVTIIVINPPAIQANAGTNQEICNATSFTLQGNNASPAAGLWTVASGQTGIVFSDATQPNATVTGLIPGQTYQFTWTITPGAPCAPNSSTVTITDDSPPVGGTTSSNATVCAGSNGATITLTGQVGNILRWESSTDNGTTWQPIADTKTTLQYISLTQTTQYRAVIQNGVCAITYSTVTVITVNPQVVIANAGGNQQLCGATSFTLQGNDPSPFVGVWTQTAGPATTIVSPNNFQTQVTGLVPGNDYSFLWTIIAQAPCANSSDPVQIHDLNDVIASFTADKTDGCGSYTVNFTNTSTSLTGVSFQWNFGDGSPISTAISPTHTFVPRSDGKDTSYTVSLNIINNCFQRAPYTVNVTVRPDTPAAYIVPQQIIGCSPFTLAVDNYSPGNNKSYTYYLYDGSTLIQQIVTTNKNEVRFDPITTTTSKTYTLYMVATGFCGNTGQSKIIPITISVTNIVAQMFIENGINSGCVPLTVNFVNNSVGADTYYYTIYDVNHVVVDRRQGGLAPLPYTFSNTGTYYVTVTAMNSCSSAESNPPIRIDVNPAPLPAFTADVTSGCKDVLVTFTNQTPGDANTQAASLLYDWDFGDGSVHAYTYNPPSHIYNSKNSPFTVTLTATNSSTGCSSVVSKTNYITITPPPGAEFTEKPDSITTIPNYTFSFIDQTTGNPAFWNWAFGDGSVSTNKNPDHTYADTGLYKVTLTTLNQLGCDSTISHFVRITGTPGQTFLANAFEPDGNTAELRIFMAKGSGMKEWHMQIFNNYAQCIWETRKLDANGAPVEGWDGKFRGQPMPQGVYVWQITATFINGTDWKGNVIKNSSPRTVGVVHLIR